MTNIPSLNVLLGQVYPVRPTESRGDFLDDTSGSATLAGAQIEAAATNVLFGVNWHPVKKYVRLALIELQVDVLPGTEVVFLGHCCSSCGAPMIPVAGTIKLMGLHYRVLITVVCTVCSNHDFIWIDLDKGYDEPAE